MNRSIFSRMALGLVATSTLLSGCVYRLNIQQGNYLEGRTVDQKTALYKAIADGLAKSPGIRPEDVFINLVEVKKENWSFGNGIAQYAA